MDKKAFLNAVETLKLYRRAELIDESGEKLIEQLYVDPLPNEHVLTTILKENSTFLIGRKGTGKSTIFQRAQEELNKRKNVTWAYIDIKMLFESSQAEILANPEGSGGAALDIDAIQKIRTFQNFSKELVKEIKKQIQQRIRSNKWKVFKRTLTRSDAEIFETLDEYINEINKKTFIDATGNVVLGKSATEQAASSSSVSLGAQGTFSGGGAVQVDAKSESEESLSEKFDYSLVLVNLFDVKRLIDELCNILKSLNINHLYIFVDDFSELPYSSMKEVVDAILAPFNNWSDELIKLKVAVYPGRMYFGDIDRSKIDEVYLDIYRAYGRNDVSGMEEKATDFTRRLGH